MENLYTYRAVIRYVYDGDSLVADIDLGFSIWVRAQALRLYRVDAPEVLSQDEKEKQLGKKTKSFVMERVLNKEVVIKTYKDRKGKYYRWLAEVYYRDREGKELCLNDILLKEGLALEFIRKKDTDSVGFKIHRESGIENVSSGEGDKSVGQQSV